MTSTGKQYAGTLVGTYPPDDLAVIRIHATGLHPATFANSSSLQVGDIVMAIGNPLGLQSTVTEGIVSAMRTAIPEGNGVTLPSAVQTTAAINPGNSGGALINLNEQVVGIPTLAATDPQLGGGAAPGIRFAIPSNTVTLIANQLITNGVVANSGRAALGAQVANTGGTGALVTTVKIGGPADQAGIKNGDVIKAIDGQSMTGAQAVAAHAPDAEARPAGGGQRGAQRWQLGFCRWDADRAAVIARGRHQPAGLTCADRGSNVRRSRRTRSDFRRMPAMPIYEFNCSKCGERFEVTGSYAEREKEHACPKCGSTEVKQAISLFSAAPPKSY